ncbi:hypothetical protein B0H21DRAFT_678345, partial [Amylocystis lapponica]
RGGIRREADLYMKLTQLQGDVVHRFYGLYEGNTPFGLTHCLVVEYCGEPLMDPLSTYDWDFRRQVLGALQKIHENGVELNTFGIGHIAINTDTDRMFIIDFANASEHACKRSQQIDFHAIEPRKFDFGCDELFDAAQLADAWSPGM